MTRPRPDVSGVFMRIQEGKRPQARIDERQDQMHNSKVISAGRPTRTERRYQVRHMPRDSQYKFIDVSYHRYRWSTYLPLAFWSAVGHYVELWDTE